MFETILSRKKVYYFCLFLIFLSALFLRFYRLADIPNAVHGDGITLGYNAWCIAHYQIDRYFHYMPIYFQNGPSGQSPLYTYLVALLIKTIGGGTLSVWLLRLPAALFSMFVVLFGTKIISLAYGYPPITLMGAALLTVCPYFVMQGRYALDCNLMLGCSTIALYCLMKFLKTNRLRHLILYSVAFGIVMYSYSLGYFVVPIFLCLITLSMLWCRILPFRRAVLSAVCVCVTALPILLFICTLLFQISEIPFLGSTIKPVAQSRMTEISLSNFLPNILTAIKRTLLTPYDNIFDCIAKFGTMYMISVPFIILGFIVSCYRGITGLKSRLLHPDFIFAAFFLSCLITNGFISSSIPASIPHANYFFIAYFYFLVCGIVSFYQFVRTYRLLFLPAMGLCYFIWTFSFVRYYFTLYSPADLITYPNSLYIVLAPDIVSYADTQLNVNAIYIDYYGCYEYQAFFSPISPYEIQQTSHEDGYGKYHFQVNAYTEPVSGNAYISHKGNREFLAKIAQSEYTWECIEYPYYYLFHSP